MTTPISFEQASVALFEALVVLHFDSQARTLTEKLEALPHAPATPASELKGERPHFHEVALTP